MGFNEFKQRDDACAALARRIGDRLRAAVCRRACASMIVSVAAPRPVFRTLRLLPVPWYLVTIVPSDEGWVPVDDDDSNEGIIRRDLLAGEPGFANFVSLYRRNRAAPEESLPELHASLKQVHRPFDAVVLGMGNDGHMASLFPDSPDLQAALHSDAECIVQAPPRSRHPHVSLTVRSLLDAREVNLLFFGERKRAVYEDSLRPGPVEQYPVRALVRQDRVPVNVYWAP